jgi:trans-aconitate methyltransferase
MKPIDRFLRAWRTRVALRVAPAAMQAVLDVGCGDSYLLSRVRTGQRTGIDPDITQTHIEAGIRLAPGRFPDDLAALAPDDRYDAIFALAVFEHLTDADFAQARDRLPDMLQKHGRLIVTVPHPLVDAILDLLMRLRLIDGQAVHEHHGFEPVRLLELRSDRLRMVYRRRFQFGLNNLFVFEKI